MPYVITLSNGKGGVAKTTSCIALGSSLAKMGYRVLLIDLDPNSNLTLGFGSFLDQPTGFSKDMFLVGRAHSVKCVRTRHKNLDVIQCGPKPPNPSELILSERLRQLMEELRERYDFIIIDAPPVGLVADALQMKDITDATMFVVRAKYTRKEHLEIIEEIAEQDKLPKPFVVLNAVNLRGIYGSYGRYSGRYLSGNGKQSSYYETETMKQR